MDDSGCAFRRRYPAPAAHATRRAVGRSGELGIVEAALVDPHFRLVTLTGPPGVGKTRLALAAARSAASRFADGEAFVDLAGIPRSGSVLGEIARAIGSSEVPGQSVRERVVDSLTRRELLLGIDNCEHFLPMPGLGEVLARCPQVRILATSRERLHLTAEREISISPLPVPDPSDLDDPARVAVSPAVVLLVACAQAVQHGFAVTAENARDVADVCIRLDGLPLALELAAAQLKVFTPGELAYRLRHRSILLIIDRINQVDVEETLVMSVGVTRSSGEMRCCGCRRRPSTRPSCSSSAAGPPPSCWSWPAVGSSSSSWPTAVVAALPVARRRRQRRITRLLRPSLVAAAAADQATVVVAAAHHRRSEVSTGTEP